MDLIVSLALMAVSITGAVLSLWAAATSRRSTSTHPTRKDPR